MTGPARWHGAAAWLQAMASAAARERRDLAALLLLAAVAVVPLLRQLPPWAGTLLLLLWGWRLVLALASRPAPSRPVLLVLLAAATVGVWLQFGTLAGRAAGVCLLLLMLGLKLLEVRGRRDLRVVIALLLFVLMTHFLYDQSLLAGLWMPLLVLALFTVLVSVELGAQDIAAAGKLRLAASAMARALPLALVLFVLFPRLPAPLWGATRDESSPHTGLSGEMTPGSIGRLLESDAIALRARFDTAAPPTALLYWRGPVLGRYDGNTWSALPDDTAPEPVQIRFDPGSRIDYTVTLEPSRFRWLMALEMPVAEPPDLGLPGRLDAAGELLARAPLEARLRYAVHSYTAHTLGPLVRTPRLQAWVELPPGVHPRARALAARIAADAAVPGEADPHAADVRRIEAVLARLRQGDYRYSLDPPPTGPDLVDGFLFDTRSGYCEHYASAFVVLMRAMDIPARVVTGYQGGEPNPLDGYLTVRQSDAHAWAEVWLDGRGWVRVDPTAAVAPERVERGARALAAAAGAGRDLALRAGTWLRPWRLDWEAAENAWNQWVLSYTLERQLDLLSSLGLAPSQRNLALAFSLAICTILAGMTLASLRRRETRDPWAILRDRLRARLAAAGIELTPSTGLRATARIAGARLASDSRRELQSLLMALERARYAGRGDDRAAWWALRRRIARFRARTDRS